jgi:hypothetical protein
MFIVLIVVTVARFVINRFQQAAPADQFQSADYPRNHQRYHRRGGAPSHYRVFQTDIARFVSLVASGWSKPAQQAFLDYALVRLVNALDPILKLTVPRRQ